MVRNLVVELEGRRALFALVEAEHERHLNESISWMRDRITAALRELVDGSDATHLVIGLREACNDYLAAVPDPPGPSTYRPLREHAVVALDRLRMAFRETLLRIGDDGDLARAVDLANRIPEHAHVLTGSFRRIRVEPDYPVRLTCTPHTDFDPEGGYYDVLLFEVFNDADPPGPVTVKSFGMEYEMYLHDTWYEREPARSAVAQPLSFPVRLQAHDGLEGWLPAGELPDDLEVKRDHIVKAYPYVEVIGYGKKIGQIG